MYAIIVDGRVASTTEQPIVGTAEAAYIVQCTEQVQVGWVLYNGELVGPVESKPDPVQTAHSYLLADAQTVEDLRYAVARIIGIDM